MNRTIGTLGTSSHELSRVKALLKLLARRTSDKWEFVESDDAQVILVDGNDKTVDLDFPNNVMKVVLLSGERNSEKNTSELSLQRPIRPGALLGMLDQLSTRLKKQKSKAYTYRGVEYG